MLKKSLLAIAILGSTSAFGATTVGDANEQLFATELFGTSSIVLGALGADIVTTVSDNVSVGATAEFTYTLTSGTFGANPTLVFSAGTGTGTSNVVRSSGGVNSSSVTFTVEVTAAFDAADQTFTFNTPSIAGADLGTEGNTVAAQLSVTNTNIVATPFDETVVVGDDGGTPAINDDVIVVSAAGLDFTVDGSVVTGIDVNDQTQFDGGGLAQNIFEQVVFTDNAEFNETGAANLQLSANDTVTITVTASGGFATNSEVCLVADATANCDPLGTTYSATISGNTATIELPGNTAVANADTDDILYEVDGNETIPTTDFTISSSVTFNSGSYASPTTLTDDSEVSLTLAGLNKHNGRINIITNANAVDETFIRVTNTAGTESLVYITVTPQDGSTPLTGQLDTIAPNATEVYTSEEIETAVGGTWSGRANAVLLTSQLENAMVVVPLVRTSDVLTNQAGKLNP